MKHNRLYAFCCVAAFVAGMVGCVADPTIDPLSEGSSTLSATVEFRPLVPTLDAATRTAGDRIKAIESLCVLLYDAEGNLIERYPLSETSSANPAPGEYKLSDAERNPGDGYPAQDGASDYPVAEARTPRATFTLPGTVPYGDYYLYAVANMGDLSDRAEAIGTVEGLRSIRLTWQTDVSLDNQMFGFFTPADQVLKQAPLLRINTPATALHAWLRRAASKVTIAYDGSGLNNQVEVYIQSVELKNIPATCPLGDANEPAEAAALLDQGEKILYSENSDYGTWPVVMNERTYEAYGIPDDRKAPSRATAHGETSEALFFYENMQGKGQSKKQTWTAGQQKPQFPDGNDPSSEGYRDNKPYGTYVEVTGYYVSNNSNRLGEGKILYRFMLGKDIDTDYNAERNHHYKLTLNFKGYGNDIDWHIVYEEEPDIYLPDPYYISYLYNQDMELPVRVTPPAGYTVTKLRADIIRNEWYPTNPDGTNPSGVYFTGAAYSIANGFLSMRKCSDAIIGERGSYNTWAAWADAKSAWREYTYDPSGAEEQQLGDAEEGTYTATKEQNSSVRFVVPMYTRAKQIYPSTGYTGNNPYVAYRRMAKVRFTATCTNDLGETKVETKEQIIWQMRRVVNPKGIWRKEGSVEPFHVIMMVQQGDESQEFVPLESDGPWTAEIEYGKEWFDLEATPGKSVLGSDGSVSGEWGTAVDFTYRPKPGSGTQCGIILIRYNNRTCHHRIFVRRGYDPLKITDHAGSPAWHSFNLIAKGREATSPADDGSMFKYGNFDQAIASSNNLQDENFEDQSNRDFTLAGGGTAKWTDIATGTVSQTTGSPIGDPGVPGARVASAEDYTYLIQHNYPELDYGYGVLYEDGTTTTQTKVSDAYGWNSQNTTNRGMRGCFVYNSDDGRNIFFPIGVTGYGRRKRAGNGSEYRERNNYTGVLRYATRWQEMPNTGNYPVSIRPLFWDLYRRPGANYWAAPSSLANPITGSASVICYSVDINYFTFDFTPYDRTITESWTNGDYNGSPIGSDALYIRLVEDD